MAEDFGASAFRHEQDARLLFGNQRYDNAAYLAGYAVECSLKLLLIRGEALHGKAAGHELGNLAGNGLAVAVVLSPGLQRSRIEGKAVNFALANWKPEMRYATSRHSAKSDADQMCEAARICLNELVIPLILDGILELPR